MTGENSKIQRNVAGRYWVQQEICLAYQCCSDEAPSNFCVEENNSWIARVYEQPETLAEEKQCRKAMNSCPIGAIRDDGEDVV